jgi:hypothetical protein
VILVEQVSTLWIPEAVVVICVLKSRIAFVQEVATAKIVLWVETESVEQVVLLDSAKGAIGLGGNIWREVVEEVFESTTHEVTVTYSATYTV